MKSLLSLIKTNRASGLSVSIVSICLSIPLAIASGATPMQGLLAAIWAGMMASLFGGSNYNIIGPAGALSGLLIAFSLSHGANLLPLLTIAIGLWILMMYLLKIAKYITLIPSTALHGFMMGVGLIIAAGQLNNIFGLTGLLKHSGMIENLGETFRHLSSINRWSVVVFLLGFLFLKIWNKYVKAIPAVLPVTILGILFGIYSASTGSPLVLTLHDQFPALAFHLFDFSYIGNVGSFSVETIRMLLQASFPIAIVAILETVISAKVADKQTNSKHNQRKEIFGLSLGNMMSGLMGGMPSTGVFVRTALNIKSGGNSRMSAFLNSIFVLIISWGLFGYFVYLPLPIIASILVNLALGMIDISLYKKLRYFEQKSFWLVLVIGLLTFLEDPIIGIIVGVIASLLLYLKDVSDGNLMVNVFRNGSFSQRQTIKKFIRDQQAGDIAVIKLPKDMTFVNMSSDSAYLEEIKKVKNVIFSFSQVQYIDMDGLEGFEELTHDYSKKGIQRYISGLGGQMEVLVRKLPSVIDAEQEGKIFASTSVILGKIL